MSIMMKILGYVQQTKPLPDVSFTIPKEQWLK